MMQIVPVCVTILWTKLLISAQLIEGKEGGSEWE